MGLESNPVGRGCAGPYADGVISWSGSLQIAGTYYVVVTHAAEAKSTYRLEARGDGVSWALQGPLATLKPQPAKPQLESVAPSAPTGKLVLETAWGGLFHARSADATGLRRITDGMDPIWSTYGAQIAFVRWQ